MTEEFYDASAALVAEKVKYTINLLRAETRGLAEKHNADLSFIIHRLDELEKCRQDHETRLRAATEGVTQFKSMISFVSLAATLLSIISILLTLFR